MFFSNCRMCAFAWRASVQPNLSAEKVGSSSSVALKLNLDWRKHDTPQNWVVQLTHIVCVCFIEGGPSACPAPGCGAALQRKRLSTEACRCVCTHLQTPPQENPPRIWNFILFFFMMQSNIVNLSCVCVCVQLAPAVQNTLSHNQGTSTSESIIQKDELDSILGDVSEARLHTTDADVISMQQCMSGARLMLLFLSHWLGWVGTQSWVQINM